MQTCFVSNILQCLLKSVYPLIDAFYNDFSIVLVVSSQSRGTGFVPGKRYICSGFTKPYPFGFGKLVPAPDGVNGTEPQIRPSHESTMWALRNIHIVNLTLIIFNFNIRSEYYDADTCRPAWCFWKYNNSLADRKPTQITQHRCGVVKLLCVGDYTSSSVFNKLQFTRYTVVYTCHIIMISSGAFTIGALLFYYILS